MSQWRGEEGSQALLGASADSQVAVPSGARESETWELNSVKVLSNSLVSNAFFPLCTAARQRAKL